MASKLKVLVIGQPFNTNTGGGITLSNLFKGWDPDQIAVVCSPYLIDSATDFKATSQYYQLGQLEHTWIFPFRLLKRRYPSGPVNRKIAIADMPETSKRFSIRIYLINRLLYPFLEAIGVMPAASRTILSKELKEWIDRFSPDVIYAQATSRGGVNFCRQIQNTYSHIPFIFHMMDDWISMPASNSLLGRFWSRKINFEFKSMIEKSSACLSVSDYMAEDYFRRYGKVFHTFHNPIDFGFWSESAKSCYELGSVCRILYAGRLGLGIDDTLKKVAQAIDSLNKRTDKKTILTLQTPFKPSWITQYTCLEHSGFVEYDSLPRVFGSSDILLLPYDFESKSYAFIKYSMPTKASEYFASGTPCLVIAPEDTAIVQYVRARHCAYVVNTNEIDAIIMAVESLIKNPDLRMEIGNEAKRIAKEFHDASQVRAEFVKVIEECVAQV